MNALPDDFGPGMLLVAWDWTEAGKDQFLTLYTTLCWRWHCYSMLLVLSVLLQVTATVGGEHLQKGLWSSAGQAVQVQNAEFWCCPWSGGGSVRGTLSFTCFIHLYSVSNALLVLCNVRLALDVVRCLDVASTLQNLALICFNHLMLSLLVRWQSWAFEEWPG
jgi:hypothetical protein